MSSPAEKLLADLSGAFGEEAVRAAVMGFQGSGGSMTPSMVTKCMAAVMASYKNVLLQILSSYYGPWDCQFARDVLLGVEFEFERSGVAEAMLPFVSDLDNFERIVIKEGCPGLASYAVSNLMEQVREEEARRQGGTPEGATNTGGGTLEEGGDGSAIFVPPTTNSNPTGTMQVVNAQTQTSHPLQHHGFRSCRRVEPVANCCRSPGLQLELPQSSPGTCKQNSK